MTFDASLSEAGFRISGTSAEKKGEEEVTWDGISEVILGRKEWFETWMDGEKKCRPSVARTITVVFELSFIVAEDQYHEIIAANDAWQIADDDAEGISAHSREFKSTNSARRIKALVEQVTGRFCAVFRDYPRRLSPFLDRYSPLPHFLQRTRFLITVQLPLLEQYQGRISSSLDAFETLSSALVRAVPGALGVSLGGKQEGVVRVDTRKLTQGVEGVQRLCKALVSAKYIEVSMEGWGEELVSPR